MKDTTITWRICPESPEHYRAAEELTRAAFWDLHAPGCSEHLLLHQMRSHPDYLPQLAFVALQGQQVVGHIAYTLARIARPDGSVLPVISFGPISVDPALQGQGIGKALIAHSMNRAKELGYGAVCIYGDVRYYGRVGFRCAERYDIRNQAGQFTVPLLACTLVPGALDSAAGRFSESPAMELEEAAAREYEKTFPQWETHEKPAHREFLWMISLRYGGEE